MQPRHCLALVHERPSRCGEGYAYGPLAAVPRRGPRIQAAQARQSENQNSSPQNIAAKDNEPKMKALSIRQPWAWLIAHGIKDIENRDWPTKFRGEFLIHAAKKFEREAYLRLCEQFNLAGVMPQPGAFELGGIVGKAAIVACVTAHSSPWFRGRYGFVVSNASPIALLPERGKLSFFESIHQF